MSVAEDEQTRFQELRLVANGGAIVDGTLRLVTSGPLAADLEAPADAVIVANFRKGYHLFRLTLMPPLTRQRDGWHDWRPPILHLGFERGFPDFSQLRSYDWHTMAFSCSLASQRLISLQHRFPATAADSLVSIYANVASVTGTITPSAAGLRLRLEGAPGPTQADDRVPALTDARLECDVLIPWTYLQAVGSDLAYILMSTASYRAEPWRPAGVGAQRLALGGSLAFFEGRLELPGQRTDLYPDGPFLLARMGEHDTMLHGATDLAMKSDGFVWPSRSNDGPQLELGFGHALFARMLGRERSATLNLRGPGIGHVDGQTGRIYESGGPCTQQITACRIHLDRSDEGLRVELAGELAPLDPGHWAKPLGPGFKADFFVPADFLMLRQWKIENLVQEWRNRHQIKFA
jgi:hypothetical protein